MTDCDESETNVAHSLLMESVRNSVRKQPPRVRTHEHLASQVLNTLKVQP